MRSAFWSTIKCGSVRQMESGTGGRPRGRPRSIDRNAVLERAMQAFWRLGYDGASLNDLTEATGVSRPTLYAAYGDKVDLFMAALDRYGHTYGTAPVQAFLAESDIRAAVTAFLRVSAEGNTEPSMPTGCLIACCAATAAETNPLVRQKLAAMTAPAMELLAGRFEEELKAGELGASRSPWDRAELLIDMMYAQAIRARTGQTRAELLADLPNRVRAVVE